MDTQWPRFCVFKQNTPDDVPENCGTIHAPDPELALLNARDVFVRRPDCHSLWIIPMKEVLSLTSEQLERHGMIEFMQQGPGPIGSYVIFTKPDYRDRYAYAGELPASDSYEAMRKALDRYPPDSHVAWRVAPFESILTSDEEDTQSWFEPAHAKPFRHPAFYRTESMMRAIRSRIIRDSGVDHG